MSTLRTVRLARALPVLVAAWAPFSACAPESDAAPGRSATTAAGAGRGAAGVAGAAASTAGAPSSAGAPPVAGSATGGLGGRTATAGSAPIAPAGRGLSAGAAVPAAGSGGAAGSSGLAGMPASAGRGAAGSGAAGMAASAGSNAAASGETGRQVGMTAAHNAVRMRIMSPAPNPPLPPLTWSTDLAKTAQTYAEKLASGGNCRDLVHSMAPGVGENLAGYTGTMATAAQVVEGWAGEEKCYTFGTFMRDDKCDMMCTAQQFSNGCGHYTQVVWRNTTQVGCGVATCGSGRGAGEVWVCNYKAQGNFVGQKAY